MEHLYLESNNLTGSIPYSINGLFSLQVLDLSQNNLEGPIPKSIGNCTSMKVFSAHSNKIYGTLLTSLANCTQLTLLDLRKNRLMGELPSYLAYFHDLKILTLAHNNLHGPIPQWITNLTKLHVLDLSNNRFSGKLPSQLDRLSGFTINESAPVDGVFSTQFGIAYFSNISDETLFFEEMVFDIKGVEYTLSYVFPINTIFDLSSNDLNGEIPTSIGGMSSLRLLNLSRNQLEGLIPASLSNISALEQLDLSKNNLSGEIPQELSKLHELGVFDVSSNNLCGPIPIGTQFSTFTVTSFQRNKCLYGCPLDTCNENKRPKREENNTAMSGKPVVGWLSRVDEKMSLMALVIGLGIGFGGVVFAFVVWEKARHWLLSPKRPQPFYRVYRFPK